MPFDREAWLRINADKLREKAKVRYQNTKRLRSEKGRRYYEGNRAKKLAAVKANYSKVKVDPSAWGKVLARSKLRLRQPEVAKRLNDRKRIRRQTDPVYKLARYDRATLWAYGISQTEAGIILITIQRGLCAICKSPGAESTKRAPWHIDHDHSTGALRGILCGRCNTALGLFRDNPDVCRAAAAYLDAPPVQEATEWKHRRARLNGRGKRR